MKMKSRHRILTLLAIILVSLLSIDAMLYHVDPIGLRRYFYDYDALQSHSLPAPDGYRYTPGHYQFAMYSTTIGSDGLRLVPANRGGDCRIAFLGDSVSFGMGANDDVTFVNRLASAIDGTVINAGLPGYSAGNVARELDTLPADGYVWLIIQNDAEPPYVWSLPSGNLPSATTLYMGYLFPGEPAAPGPEHFTEYGGSILNRSDVLAFIFDDGSLTPMVTARYPGVVVIPNYHGYVSRFDVHPNAQGHAQIADAMRDRVIDFVKERCGSR